MGNCVYCGNPVGLLRSKHKECHETFLNGKSTIKKIIRDSIKNPESISTLFDQTKQIAKNHFIDHRTIQAILQEAWDKTVEDVFEDGVVSEEEEKALASIASEFKMTQSELDKTGSYTKVVKGAVLRDVMEGKMPKNRIEFQGQLPFNLQKKEVLIWVFQNVKYYELKTKREFKGGSTGMSVRIAKGVYLRQSAFKGRPVVTQETVHIGTGLLGITNKYLYFSSGQKSFRIKFDSIMSISPYSDGIEIYKDGVSAKPQYFITGDGWFVYNLMSNIRLIE